MQKINLKTSQRNQMIDVTATIAELVNQNGAESGSVLIYNPHTTAGITINENADPDVVHDMLLTLEELFPKNRPGYQHAEGNSDSHMKASFVGSSATVIFDQGKLVLGRWQGIYFCEFDGPRNRHYFAQISRNP
jgi:secondary thiamine-phosphate synthase enzyme